MRTLLPLLLAIAGGSARAMEGRCYSTICADGRHVRCCGPNCCGGYESTPDNPGGGGGWSWPAWRGLWAEHDWDAEAWKVTLLYKHENRTESAPNGTKEPPAKTDALARLRKDRDTLREGLLIRFKLLGGIKTNFSAAAAAAQAFAGCLKAGEPGKLAAAGVPPLAKSPSCGAIANIDTRPVGAEALLERHLANLDAGYRMAVDALLAARELAARERTVLAAAQGLPGKIVIPKIELSEPEPAPAEEPPPEAPADAPKKKKKPSLLAQALALEEGAQQQATPMEVKAKALAKGMEEAREAAAAAQTVLEKPGASEGEIRDAGEKARDAAERLQEAAEFRAEPAHRVPEGEVRLTARKDAESGKLVFTALEHAPEGDRPAVAARVEIDAGDGKLVALVADADGRVELPLENLNGPARVIARSGSGSALERIDAGDLEAASLSLEDFAGSRPGSEKVHALERAAALAPERAETQSALGRTYEELGVPEAALGAYICAAAGSGSAADAARASVVRLGGILPVERPVPREALDAVKDAGKLVERSRWDAAVRELDRAIRLGPWWEEPYWLRAQVREAQAGEPGPGALEALAAARADYGSFLSVAPAGDSRKDEARRRSAASEAAERSLRLPPDTAYTTVVKRIRTNQPRFGLKLGAPNLYLDIGGAAVSSDLVELHGLRVMLFSPKLRFGLGTTALSQYRTKFDMRAAGRGRENAVITNIFPVEAAIAPFNIKSWRNTVISPQFYLYACGWGVPTSASLGYDETGFRATTAEYGLRVPLGPLLGLRVASTRIKVPAERSPVLGPAFLGFDERKTYVAVELFLGGMFGVPKAK